MNNRILIVDDAAVDLELVSAVLTNNGFAVITAQQGWEGLVKAKAHLPNLIISDVLMPDMDGFTLFKELRKDPTTTQIPVLILTVRGRMQDTFEVMGVEHFMLKPFDADNLLLIINKYVASEIVAREPKIAEEKSVLAATVTVSPQPAVVKSPERQDPAAMATAKKKVVIFGSDDGVMESMVKLFEKEKCYAVVKKDEAELPVLIDSMEPDLILLQLNSHLNTPVDKIIFSLNNQIEKKRADNKSGVTSGGNIVLYKVTEEISGLDSAGGNLVDTENLLDRCTEAGCKKYIGIYSPIVFMIKIWEFIT